MRHPSSSKRSAALAIEYLESTSLRPAPGNARKHSTAQLVRLQAAIREFGFTAPILIDTDQNVIAGHARLLAAQALSIERIPCVRLEDLSEAQKRALAIADNRIAELAEWDPEALRAEFAALCELEFPVELTGFETAEIDLILETPNLGEARSSDPADLVAEPDRTSPPVSRLGDCWSMDNHRLNCGDALAPNSYEAVLAGRAAAMAITDPPYNVPIDGHVSGLGKTRHREFVMASGEMSYEAFTGFLKDAMDLMVRFSVKNGTAPHQNNVQLGKHGRYRTNVWDYAGVEGANELLGCIAHSAASLSRVRAHLGLGVILGRLHPSEIQFRTHIQTTILSSVGMPQQPRFTQQC